MRSAIIKDGIVTNVIVGSIEGSVECPPDVGIGWSYDSSTFTPPPPPAPEPEPEPIPNSISIRQLRIGLVLADWITQEQAVEWRKGNSLPQPIQDVISQMPKEQQFIAEETAFSMYEAQRNNSLLLAAAQAAMPETSYKEVNEALDQAFQEWAKL